ncbi:hypothetical protein V5799_014971 [Amblyomma americanum]|uniref:Uncharacterized protein n=1 Tax=Amblyomma americanum TaxID=6943 RepID=A0AAQ4E1H3_AMBAM
MPIKDESRRNKAANDNCDEKDSSNNIEKRIKGTSGQEPRSMPPFPRTGGGAAAAQPAFTPSAQGGNRAANKDARNAMAPGQWTPHAEGTRGLSMRHATLPGDQVASRYKRTLEMAQKTRQREQKVFQS